MSSRRPLYEALRDAVAAGRPVALAEVIGGAPVPGAKLLLLPGTEPRWLGTLGDRSIDEAAARECEAVLARGVAETRTIPVPAGELVVFIEPFTPPPRLVVVGAVDVAAALAAMGRLLGYRVSVVDGRPAFATTERFPAADEVVAAWPDRYLRALDPPLTERDAVCVLTHDRKFDLPALVAALESAAGYVGAMGSRRTHAERVERLVTAGVDPSVVERRLMSPIGLDLGARTPAETALAICAEIVARRTGSPAASLRNGEGPIHRR